MGLQSSSHQEFRKLGFKNFKLYDRLFFITDSLKDALTDIVHIGSMPTLRLLIDFVGMWKVLSAFPEFRLTDSAIKSPNCILVQTVSVVVTRLLILL